MLKKSDHAPDGQLKRSDGGHLEFSGFWFRMPSETDALMCLKPLELKAYLVIARAIQRDRAKGLISVRQIQQRTHSRSLGCTQGAVDALCSLGFFTRHNPKTGAKLTDPADWKAREVEYRLNFEWKQRDADNCSALPEQLSAAGLDRNALRNAGTQNTPNCSAVPEQNCSAVPEQHSESSELLDLKTSSDGDAVSAFSGGLSLSEANGQADYRFASAKGAEDSPDQQSVTAANAENKRANRRAHAPANPAGEMKPLLMEAGAKSHWSGRDVTNVGKWLSAFMDGDDAPPKLVSWIIEFAAEYRLQPGDIHRALDIAWKRRAAPGQRNAPRSWNWFYEVLRAAFIQGYAARLPEAPSAPHPAHQSSTEELQRGIEALDGSLVATLLCPRCGGELRQYTDRVEGTCTCGRSKRITPAPGK